MAIDGVAPRAKMNQQRSRRFRTAAEREEQKVLEAKIRKDFKEQGMNLPESTSDGDIFDSNVITPGTDFMDRLSMVLQWWAVETHPVISLYRNQTDFDHHCFAGFLSLQCSNFVAACVWSLLQSHHAMQVRAQALE